MVCPIPQGDHNNLKAQIWSPVTTSGLETEQVHSQRGKKGSR